MKKPAVKNTLVKNILSALAVAVFGFILLNVAFIFDSLFQRAIIAIVSLFVKGNLFELYGSFPITLNALFFVVIALISWFVFRSRLRVLFKAIYMTVPLAAVFAIIGILLYPWPALVLLAGAFAAFGIYYYLYVNKQPWLYYYTVALVGLTLAIFSLLGGEI